MKSVHLCIIHIGANMIIIPSAHSIKNDKFDKEKYEAFFLKTLEGTAGFKVCIEQLTCRFYFQLENKNP